MSGTKVAVPAEPGREREIVGYFTLLQHEYRDRELPNKTARGLKVMGLKRVPVILLAQLGVRSDLQHSGLGSVLMRHALELCLVLSRELGSVAVITDPMSDRLVEYYCRKFGFADIGLAHPVTGRPRLFLATKTIERAYIEAKQEKPA